MYNIVCFARQTLYFRNKIKNTIKRKIKISETKILVEKKQSNDNGFGNIYIY